MHDSPAHPCPARESKFHRRPTSCRTCPESAGTQRSGHMKKNYPPPGLWPARLALVVLVLAVTVITPGRAAAAGDVRIANFPSVQQWYSLSCEYAAAAAVTLYWGDLVSQRDFLR